jgi:hypothetical protein
MPFFNIAHIMKPRTAKPKKSQPSLAAANIRLKQIAASVDDAKSTLDALYLLLTAVVERLAEEQGRAKK